MLSLPQPAPSGCSAITDVQKLPGYTLHHAPQAQLPSLQPNSPVCASGLQPSHSGSSTTKDFEASPLQNTLTAEHHTVAASDCTAIDTRGGEALTKVPRALPLSFGPVNSLVPSRDLSKPVLLSSLSSVSSGYSSAFTE